MSYAWDFFGQTMRQMSAIPEGHLIGIDEHGNIVDRGPAPEGADDTWSGPCLVGAHEDCAAGDCGCPHHHEQP